MQIIVFYEGTARVNHATLMYPLVETSKLLPLEGEPFKSIL